MQKYRQMGSTPTRKCTSKTMFNVQSLCDENRAMTNIFCIWLLPVRAAVVRLISITSFHSNAHVTTLLDFSN